MVNQPDIVMVNKHKRTAGVVDMAFPSNIRKKEHKRLGKCQGLKEELEKMWV